ncbi:immunoglobulin-like domain-containing protein [Pontibacter beigongshangensis]|uniref:immunoglobulin-like domain-containing protein n=1 Tax=Pontibacter beigongshangensis TaxID=2574733 RepID=UPI00164FFA15|nr:immunoglobulin-like domain-containing protein [Pontibacter beigongshangensis]
MRHKNRIVASVMMMLLTSFALLSCEKDDETANISFVTTYPDFEMTGGLVVLVKGEEYVEPGVVATESGQEIEITTSVVGSAYIDPANSDPSNVSYTSSIDTNVPGIYTITYSATNSDNFSGSTTRTLIVLDAAPDPTVDLSGHYISSTSPASDITKVADGVFYATNFWGGGSTVVLAGYILTSDGVNLNIPMQESLVPIYGYGTRLANGTLDLRMTRPTFSPPLIDQVKVWEKE